jgi:hypothetical protein
MVLHCPVCHSKYTVDDLIREGIRDDLIDLAAFFGNVWPLVNEYCDCFRSGQWGSVGEKKKVRLLQELKTLFEKAEFECDGKRYRTDRAAVLGALRAVCDAEKFGFKNHNYLKRVLLSGSGKTESGRTHRSAPTGKRPERVSAEGLTALEENDREKRRAQAPGREDNEEGEIVRVDEFMRRKGIKSLIDAVGQKME